MGIISRFKEIMSANINAQLDKMEDPAKMVDQTLYNLKNDLAQVQSETAEVMASAKAAQREVDTCQAKIDQYNSAARNALKKGEEGDARTLLATKQQYEDSLVGLQQNLAAANDNVVKMREMYDKLSSDIKSLETRKATIKAKVATAKAQETVNRAAGRINSTSADMAAFERMEQKADKMLDSANAMAELNKDKADQDNLVNKYSGVGGASVDDEIERLKRELGMYDDVSEACDGSASCSCGCAG